VLVTVPLAAVAGLLVLISSSISTTFLGLYLMAVAGLATAAVVGNTRRFMLAIVIADVALAMDKSFFLRTPHQGGAKGVELSLTTMMILPYWLMWLAEARYRHKNKNSYPGLALSIPTVGTILVSTLSVFAAKDPSFSIFALVRLFQFLLLYAYIVHNVQSKEDLTFYLNTVMVVVLLESLLMMIQYSTKFQFKFMGLGSSSIEESDTDPLSWRVGGTFGSPNVAAAYLVPCLLLILGVLMSRPTLLQKYLGIGAVGASLSALVATQSRAGLITTITLSTLLAILALRRRYVKPGTVLFLALIALLVTAIFSRVILHRLTTEDSGSARDRVPMMQVAENMVRAHPILGVGVNNYAVVMRDYPGLSVSKDFAYVVHNRYMLIWAETGTLGLLCLVWFVAVWLRNAYYAYRLDDPHLSPIALGMIVGAIGSLIIWNSESLPGRQEEQAIWMQAALAAALYGLAWAKRHRLTGGETRHAASRDQSFTTD
jgi:hypothetical protein